jgi:hypothetical protein
MASGISGAVRFIGLVTGITGLGAVLARGTQAHFIRTVATSGLSGSVAGCAQVIVSRIISGDIAGALEHVAPAARAALIEVCRGSFAAGFTSVLIVAGGIAALGALLTVLLVSTVEAGAARRPRGAASRLPRVGLIGADQWRPAMFKMSKCFAQLFHSPRSGRGTGLPPMTIRSILVRSI